MFLMFKLSSSSNVVMISHDWALIWRSLEAVVVSLKPVSHDSVWGHCLHYAIAAAILSVLQCPTP